MKLKALSTIIGKDEKRAKPGEEFNIEDLGISAKEAEVLIARKFAAEAVIEPKPVEPKAVKTEVKDAKPKAADKAGADGATG